jgi:hypothetical protein
VPAARPARLGVGRALEERMRHADRRAGPRVHPHPPPVHHPGHCGCSTTCAPASLTSRPAYRLPPHCLTAKRPHRQSAGQAAQIRRICTQQPGPGSLSGGAQIRRSAAALRLKAPLPYSHSVAEKITRLINAGLVDRPLTSLLIGARTVVALGDQLRHLPKGAVKPSAQLAYSLPFRMSVRAARISATSVRAV